MKSIIDENIVWKTLAGPHACHAVGGGEARRYRPGFPPFIGFADLARPRLDALIPHVEPGEHLYCDGWAGAAPAHWRILSEGAMHRMIWDAPLPVDDPLPQAVLLGAQHMPALFELVAMAQPGPFAPRAPELGEYVGLFDGRRLVATAGTRHCAGGFIEVTGVCTHPDLRGQGLATRLVSRLVRWHAGRGATAFLRVIRDNAGARRLYQRMGFRDDRITVARVIALAA